MAIILTKFEDRVKAAKKFAAMHCYKGAAGGWIYNDAGQAVAQGWSGFYRWKELHTDMQIIAEGILKRAAEQAEEAMMYDENPDFDCCANFDA